jgi:cellulose/xylan binding protein with CBM9 domain/fibronectin type III domain protein
MRLSALAIGPVVAGCALIAVTSCSTDEPQTEPGLAPTMSPAVTDVSAYDIVKVPAMTIDGNLSEWANITAISMADNSGRTGGVDNTAKVKLAWDDSYLYAAYDVTDTELLAIQTTREASNIYQDDGIELYIDPQGDGASATSMTPTDYQFLSNILEAMSDLKGDGAGGKDGSYLANSFLTQAVTNGTVNATGTDTGYTLELRIAWSDLGVTPAAGNFMRIDPVVDDRDGAGPPPTQSFDWAGLTGNYNQPNAWKDVRLVNPPPAAAYNIVKVPSITVDGNLNDWTGVSAISMADNSGRTGGVDNTAKVKLAWDNTYLYAAYDVTDTELLALQTAREASNIYQDDAIELYVDPQGDGAGAASMTTTDYQFLANIREALSDFKGDGAGGKDGSFLANSFLAQAIANGTVNASGTDTSYALELRIAWSDLGVTPGAGKFMRIDPVVDDRDGAGPPPTQSFDWAGLTGNYNNPGGWKDVGLVIDNTAPAAPTSPTLTVVSSSQIDVSWTASTSSDVAKYNIYRATTGTPTLFKTVTASPYHDTGLTAGTSYTYQISAVDAAGNESPRTAAKSATTTGGGAGIPYGLFGIKADSIPNGTIWTGSTLTSKNLNNVLNELQAARTKSPRVRMWFNIVSGDEQVFDVNGSFNLQAWKDTLDNHVKPINPDGTSSFYDDLLPYMQDGTLQGFQMLDDITNYPNNDPTFAQLDAMAAYMKKRFPEATTAVRATATTLKTISGGQRYTQLDVAWAQYRPTRGPVITYRTNEISAAQSVGLGLIFGMNIRKGMADESPVPPDSIRVWGSELLKAGASDYACGFMMWDAQYVGLNNSAFSTLANLAKNHVAAPCKRR